MLVIETAAMEIVKRVPFERESELAQIARYSPDGQVPLITGMRSDTATSIDASFATQTTLAVERQPMDGAFDEDRLLIACQGDGTVHVIDLVARRVVHQFAAGVGCETLAFF